jgi:hypothetical protein
MHYRTIARSTVVAALATLAMGSSFTLAPNRTEAGEAAGGTAAAQLAQAGRYGPFATIRRANEYANYFRSRGYNAQVVPEWGAYYVNVW